MADDRVKLLAAAGRLATAILYRSEFTRVDFTALLAEARQAVVDAAANAPNDHPDAAEIARAWGHLTRFLASVEKLACREDTAAGKES